MSAIHVHVPYARLDEHLPLIKQHRLNLEIFFSAESLDSMRPGDLEAVLDRLDYGPSLSVHAPFMDLSPGAVDPRVREVTMERFSRTLDIGRVLKPQVIVFHSGYEKWKYARKVTMWLEPSVAFWKPLVEQAEEMRTIIAIENIFEDEPTSLAELMDAIASPCFGICFDTGHCNLFSRVPLENWIEELGDRIAEFHVHDNDGTCDAHLPIGEGSFDFDALFALFGRRDIVMTVETHTPERVLRGVELLGRKLTKTQTCF